MLDFMRKHAGTWMIKALLFAIVVVFVFWGVGSWTSQQEGVVATVNGEAISSTEQLRSLISKAGKRIAVLVDRGSARIFIPVDLG